MVQLCAKHQQGADTSCAWKHLHLNQLPQTESKPELQTRAAACGGRRRVPLPSVQVGADASGGRLTFGAPAARTFKRAARVCAALHWRAAAAATSHRRTRKEREGRRAAGGGAGPCAEQGEGDAELLWKVRPQERLERRRAPPWMDVSGA